MLGVAIKAADAASALDDTSQRTGMAAEEYQKYAYAAKLSGIETETLEKAIIKQQKAFADAKTGSKSMGEAYSKLGIDINKIGTSSEAFDQVITKLADMEDITQRDALANDIFGKSYAELAPLLNEGSDGINKLKQEAVDLGGVMSNESVAAGAKFGDTLDSVKTAFGGVVMKLGVEFLPMLQQLLDWVIANMPEIQATISTVFGVISEVVSFVWDIFSEDLLPILIALWDFISPTFPLIADVVKVTFGIISEVVGGVIDIFEGVTGAIKTALEWLGLWNDEPAKEKETKVKTARVNRGDYDGSHANGLAYVPYNGYVAELHEGERVLTKEQNKGGTSTINHTGTIRVEGVNNKGELVAVVEQEITNNIVSGNRRIPNRTSLIPIG